MSNMRYVRFGELYKIPSCNGLSRPSAVRGEGYKMVNMGELFSNDIINDMYMERVQMNDRELKKFLLEKGDLLFARQSLVASGAGKCSIVNNLIEETTFESHLIRVRLDKSIANPLYYYYLFQLPYNPVKTIVNQCAQAGIRGTELVRIKVPLPDIEYQNTIANTLFQYDNLIENNNKRIRLLEQMAENLYKEWFVRFRFPGYEKAEFENGIPKGWNVEKIKKCVKKLPFNQLYKQKDLEDEGTVIVIDQSSSDFLGFHNNEPSHYASVEKPIILFGDHSCKFVLMIRDFSLGENVVPFTTSDENELDNYYLYYAVHKLISTEEYKRHWGRFTAMKIFVPPYQLQKSFSDIVTLLIEEKQKLWNENQLLKKQRDMLLPRLMSGKLEV